MPTPLELTKNSASDVAPVDARTLDDYHALNEAALNLALLVRL